MDHYLHSCFGFDLKLLPAIIGINWVDEEVDCATPIVVLNREHKVILWQKVSIQQKISDLPSIEQGNITEGIFKLVTEFTTSLAPLNTSINSGEQIVRNNSSVETAMLVLETLKSLVGAKGDHHHFWEPVSATMCTTKELRPFLISLQTQALLHNLHIHVGFPCPVCKHIPIENFIGLFGAEVTLPLPILHSHSYFVAFVHLSPTLSLLDGENLSLKSLCEHNVTVIDAIDGSVDGKTLKLKFFAPLHLTTRDFNVTIARILLHQDIGHNVIHILLPATKIKAMQIKFVRYHFSPVPRITRSESCVSATKIISTSAKPLEPVEV